MHKLSDRSPPFGTYRNLWKDSTRMRTKCFDNNEAVINDQKHTSLRIYYLLISLLISMKRFLCTIKRSHI